MHMAWPTVESMNPQSPGANHYNPYSDLDNHDLEMDPLGWDTSMTYVTMDNLGAIDEVDRILEERRERDAERAARRRKGMIKVGIFGAVAAGAAFLLFSDVLGLK
jgi:hypothetical protein